MSDPWEDVRGERDRKWPVYESHEVEQLLSDADALLATVRELAPHAKDAYTEDFVDWYDDDFWREWLGRNYPALAALPDHLR